MFIAIVCCYTLVFNACWLLNSAYGCARLTLPSQRIVKSFVTDGAKIVFCNLWRSESTQSFMFSFVYVNLKIILCCLLLQYLLFIAIVCCYFLVFNACWLLSSAYGCVRLTLSSQRLVKSFVTDGAKIGFASFGDPVWNRNRLGQAKPSRLNPPGFLNDSSAKAVTLDPLRFQY